MAARLGHGRTERAVRLTDRLGAPGRTDFRTDAEFGFVKGAGDHAASVFGDRGSRLFGTGAGRIALSHTQRAVAEANLLDARSDADVIVEIEFLAVEEARNRMRTRRIPIGVLLRKRRSRKNSWEKQKDRRRQDCPHRLASWNSARLIVTRQQPFAKLTMPSADF